MPEVGRMNVLMVTCDQLPWNAVGYNANREVRTPCLNQLALQGCSFSHCYAPHPCAAESTQGLLAGQYASRFTESSAKEPNHLLPGMLRGQGYHCAAFGAVTFSKQTRTAAVKAFDDLGIAEHLYLDSLYQRWLGKQSPEHLSTIQRISQSPMEVVDALPPELTPNSFIARRSLEYLQQRAADPRPFLCVAGFHNFAFPRIMPQKWLAAYDPATLTPFHPDGMSTEAAGCSNAELQALTQHYYATVSEADSHIGILLRELDRLHLAENTIVVFTSIRGFGMEGEAAAKAVLPDWAVRVPLIVRGPAGVVQDGISCHGLSETTDIVPGILELLGLPIPAAVRGISLRPVLAGKTKEYRDTVLIERPGQITLRSRYLQYSVDMEGVESFFDHSQPSGQIPDVAGEMRYRGALMDHRYKMIGRLLRLHY